MSEKKKIGNVVLDYQFYNPQLFYSDGKIEETLLQASIDNQLKKLLHTSNDWAVLYHCSDIRENLLEWYPFKKEGNLLEIGSGCGALTGLFSRKVSSVTCLELSERRSMINAYRHQECDNIEILLGNFQDIQIDEKFDYITLIGVWEYAGHFVKEKNPYIEMLKKVKQYLKDDGKVLIAIENKMGLKYWNGAPEDHTGVLYDGLNDYADTENVSTFSKKEIETILKTVGWNNWKFYYPMPDYKLPETIYTDDRLPNPGEIRNYGKDYSASRIYHFYDASVSDQLCHDKMIDYFANSFLIECCDEPENVIFAKYNHSRKDKYKVSTIIKKENNLRMIYKSALHIQAQEHIAKMAANSKTCYLPIDISKGNIQEGSYVTDYIYGQDLDVYLYSYRKNIELFIYEVQKIVQNYLTPDDQNMEEFYMTDNDRTVFGEKYVNKAKSLKNTNIDMIFSNLRLAENGKVFCIDNEWIFDFPIPYEYVLWRSLSQLYDKYVIYLRKKMNKEKYLSIFNLKEENIKIYEDMEKHFCEYCFESNYLDNYKKSIVTYNVNFN